MNNNEHFGKYISLIYRKGRSFINKELMEQGIGSGQFIFLIQLYKKDGVSQENLSEILLIDKGTTARAIKKLEDEGFITRTKDEFDKRAYKIYLTKKAIDLEPVVYDALTKWENTILQNISVEEKNMLLSLLSKLSV